MSQEGKVEEVLSKAERLEKKYACTHADYSPRADATSVLSTVACIVSAWTVSFISSARWYVSAEAGN